MLRDLLARIRPGRAGGSDLHTSSISQDWDQLACEAYLAPVETQPRLYMQLGHQCVRSGDTTRALSFYGRAVDAYLEIGHFDPAAALCRKMIALKPDVVRARCTLAFLSLGKGFTADAEREITEYVQAAQRSRGEELASERLRMMATVTDDPDGRLLIATLLQELGDAEGAETIFGELHAERNGFRARPQRDLDQRERWARMLRVAIVDSREPEENFGLLNAREPIKRRVNVG